MTAFWRGVLEEVICDTTILPVSFCCSSLYVFNGGLMAYGVPSTRGKFD